MNEKKQNKYIYGLDSIRFVAAMWVVFGHGSGFPLLEGVNKESTIGWFLNGIYNNFFSGPAAVIVFFLISGIVIHYPYVNGKTFLLTEFYLRRYLRIAIPLFAAIAISMSLDVKLSIFQDSILWSLIAELIYYTFYPFLRWIICRVSWTHVIAATYFLAFMVVMSNPSAGNYPSYGPYLNWLLGLPCWLLGCLLAETKWSELANSSTSTRAIYRWRTGIFFVSVICSILRYHTPIGYPWTLNIFAILVFFWLRHEIAYFNFGSTKKTSKLEIYGIFSYSIYLTHLLSKKILVTYIYPPNLGFILNWAIEVSFILLFSYGFYRLVEKPAHFSARYAGRRCLKSHQKQQD